MFESVTILDIFLSVLILFAAYCSGIYLLQKIYHLSVQEAKAIIWQKIRDALPGAQPNIPMKEETLVEILDVTEKFSEISRKNTVWTYNNFSEIPFLRVEVMDSGFENHWSIMESNISRVLQKLFTYQGADGDFYVTYERTVTENLYRIVVYWATSQRSQKALEKLRRNIMEYRRRVEMEKTAPFIDEKLEDEMDGSPNG
ncbi:MAG: hypothetical protein HFI74_12335 [Lachnospiraceae bacterium]|jgi:hypothetical protein|nr:hypothetical protein [Lachnospiraceae bacterium]